MDRRQRSVTLVLIAMAAGLVAEAPQDQRRDPPVFGTGVTLVAVPVFVTDKSGRSVGGLTIEDFEIEGGGKKVPIVSFQAIDVDAPVTPESQAQLAALPVAVQAAAPRQFLLLFDLGFSPTQGIIRGRAAGMAFVRNALAPGDLVAVAVSSRRGLEVLANFTTDRERAARAIESLGLTGTFGTALLGESGDLAAGASGRLAAELAEMQVNLNAADQFLYTQTVYTFMDDISQLVTMLSPLRGRKQVVLLSAGFRGGVWRTDSPLLGKMNSLFQKAGLGDVVIHAISLDGLQAGAGRDTLVYLSQSTGGRFILPRNDFSLALGDVDRISRHSYVVAFEAEGPAGQGGKPRKLKVRVRGAGRLVSHRPFYALPGPSKPKDAAALKDQADEALEKGLSGGPLRLRLSTLSYRDSEGTSSVHSVLQIDGPALTEAAKGAELAIQVYGYSMRDGVVLDSLALNTTMDLSKLGDAVRSSGISLIASFPASPGVTDLRFFVRSGAEGVTGSIQRNVAIPPMAESVVLSAPMFPLSPAGRVVVPLKSAKGPQVRMPFRVGDAPFVPDGSPVLTPGSALQACVFVWRGPAASTGPLEVSGEITRPGEAPRPVRIEGAPRVVRDPDGTDRYLVGVVAPDASPGAYTLRLAFKDPATGVITSTEAGVVIEK